MNERQDKQVRFSAETQPSKLRNRLLLGAVLLLAVGALGWCVSRTGASASGVVTAQNGTVAIPLIEVGDGLAHFYRYHSSSKAVAFFVVRGGDGQLRAALDTCDVCYAEKKGYRQQGNEMVCNNCDQRFPTDKINQVSGGCNPVGISFRSDGERLTIDAAVLDQGTRYF